MTRVKINLRQHAARLVAFGLILALYGLTRLPEISNAERHELAQGFSFRRLPLPELAHQKYQSVRQVNPSLQRISAWISSVGAAVALNDLDGDGVANDVCSVDTRTEIVRTDACLPARFRANVMENVNFILSHPLASNFKFTTQAEAIRPLTLPER